MKSILRGLTVIGLLFSGFSLRAQAQSQTIFTSQAPAQINQTDGRNVNYELGTLFRSKAAGQITAIRFWKDSRETGSHTGHIWSASGQLLASVTFTSESASSWQQQALSTPLSIVANTTYMVSVNTGNTYYVATENGLTAQVVNKSLSTTVGNNGAYGPPGRFPTSSWNYSNYFRDVVFVPSSSSGSYSISGTVSPALVGARTRVTLGGQQAESTTADSAGNYSFSGLAGGNYTVTPKKSGVTFSPALQTVNVTNSNMTAINFTVATAQTFSISGTISGSGGNGATVSLSGASTATTTANSSGSYTFTGLTNGTYAVTPGNAGFNFSPSVQSVTVNGSNLTGVNFTSSTAPQTFSISGTISPAATGSGSTVTLTGSASASTTANSSGTFSFTGLPNGSYTVTPTNASATFNPTTLNVTVNGANQTAVNFTATATSNVIFYDDFTSSSLSSSWLAMNTFGRTTNSELQCYVPAADSVSGGYLVITSTVQNVTCGQSGKSSSPYSSGMVQWPTFNFTYGTVEYRAKFAGGTGTWPAIWLLGYKCQTSSPYQDTAGCPWPQAGSNEIDITEIKDGDLTSPWQNVVDPSGNWFTCRPTVTDVSQNFHVYDFTWTATSLTWSIDGVQTCQQTSTDYIPTQPMFLIINTAIGGNGGGSVNTSTFPQTLQVDYVKVTQP